MRPLLVLLMCLRVERPAAWILLSSILCGCAALTGCKRDQGPPYVREARLGVYRFDFDPGSAFYPGIQKIETKERLFVRAWLPEPYHLFVGLEVLERDVKLLTTQRADSIAPGLFSLFLGPERGKRFVVLAYLEEIVDGERIREGLDRENRHGIVLAAVPLAERRGRILKAIRALTSGRVHVDISRLYSVDTDGFQTIRVIP